MHFIKFLFHYSLFLLLSKVSYNIYYIKNKNCGIHGNVPLKPGHRIFKKDPDIIHNSKKLKKCLKHINAKLKNKQSQEKDLVCKTIAIYQTRTFNRIPFYIVERVYNLNQKDGGIIATEKEFCKPGCHCK